MDLIENIINYFKNQDNGTQEETSPEGICPVCWGFQEYDGKIRTLFKDKQIDVNNHKDSYMLIEEFMVQHIDGIKLKEGVVTDCPNCQPKKEEMD